MPASNLFARKSVHVRAGRFDTRFRSGEDTLLCHKLAREGVKALYVPNVVVYHHPRPLFVPHLRQVMTYGIHRGFFMKRYPETSRKVVYMLPSIFLISVVAGTIPSLLCSFVGHLFLSAMACYL